MQSCSKMYLPTFGAQCRPIFHPLCLWRGLHSQLAVATTARNKEAAARLDSNSECNATGGNCGSFGEAPHVANFPLRRCCVQVVHKVNDFCFQWVPLRSDSGIGNVEVLHKDSTRVGWHMMSPSSMYH